MRRKLSNFAAAVSLTLCAATVVLWVRSNNTRYEVWLARHSCYSVAIQHGCIEFSCEARHKGHAPDSNSFVDDGPAPISLRLQAGMGSYGPLPPFARVVWSRAGIAVLDRGSVAPDSPYVIMDEHFHGGPMTIRYESVIVVHGAYFVAVFAFLPLTRLIRLRRNTDGASCAICLYNLTGNTSGVCSECGTPITGTAEVKG